MNAPQPIHVLVPVDLGPSSEAALRCAQTLGTAFGARLTLMYVDDALTLQDYDDIYAGYREIPDEQSWMLADQVTQWARRIVGRDATYDVLVAADDPARAIATAAARRDASLIVMGTHRRSGWDRLMGGSLAEAVLHRTDRPVMTVPKEAGNAMAGIVCPVDFSDGARRATRTACSVGTIFNANLHLLHVGEKPVPQLAQRLREWAGAALTRHCNVHEIVARGHSAAERIAEYASSVTADAIVVGAEQRTHGERAALGTTTERIMRSAPVAVMSVVRPFTLSASMVGAA